METQSLEHELQARLVEFWGQHSWSEWSITSELSNGIMKATITHDGKPAATAHVWINLQDQMSVEDAERTALITAIGRMP